MDEMEAMQIKDFAKDMDKTQRIVYYEQKKKSGGIALLLSLIIPGAGQMYLGKVGMGIILFFTFGLSCRGYTVFMTHISLQKTIMPNFIQ